MGRSGHLIEISKKFSNFPMRSLLSSRSPQLHSEGQHCGVWAGFCLGTEDEYKHRRLIITSYIKCKWNFPALLLLIVRIAETNSIPGQEPWSSALVLHRGQKMTLLGDLARQMQDSGKQDKADRHAQWQKEKYKGTITKQIKKQCAQQPVTLLMNSFVFLIFFI